MCNRDGRKPLRGSSGPPPSESFLELHSENIDSYIILSDNHGVHLTSKDLIQWKLQMRGEEQVCNRQTLAAKEECLKTLKLLKVGPRTKYIAK